MLIQLHTHTHYCIQSVDKSQKQYNSLDVDYGQLIIKSFPTVHTMYVIFYTKLKGFFFLQLSNEERVAIAKHVVDKTAGRVPVVVGATFEGGLEEQARLMNEMGRFADSVVIITNQIASMDDVSLCYFHNCV